MATARTDDGLGIDVYDPTGKYLGRIPAHLIDLSRGAASVVEHLKCADPNHSADDDETINGNLIYHGDTYHDPADGINDDDCDHDECASRCLANDVDLDDDGCAC